MNRVSPTRMDLLMELKGASFDLSVSFLRHLLLVCTTLLGILISFHDSDSSCSLYIRLHFGICVAVLSLGILACGIALFGYVRGRRLAVTSLLQDIQSELYPSEPKENVRKTPEGFFEICEIVSYVLLSLAMLGFGSYAILISL